MENKFKIKYLPSFYNDLDSITDYIKYKLENEIAANNFVNELEKEIKQRAYSPDTYEEYKTIKKRTDKYYRIYVKNYTVFYVVRDNTMELRRILSNRRNFDNLI